MTLLDIISNSCPLILCSLGALYSEFAGVLALFLEGMICLSGFLFFLFSTLTQNVVLGFILTIISGSFITFLISLAIEKFKANYFIAGTAANLLFASIISCLSSIFFKTRGVLSSPLFSFNIVNVKFFIVILSVIVFVLGIIFLYKTRNGLYLRITGDSAEVLLAKGCSPVKYRILAWNIATFYGCISGCFLVLRIGSFVPNIASGRGWMALAAVFLGKKKYWKIITSVLIFCATDYLSSNIQNYTQAIPQSLLLALPYIICIILIFIKIPQHHQDQK